MLNLGPPGAGCLGPWDLGLNRLGKALAQILETVVIFHFSGGKVYSLNKGHTCMIKHTMHVQSLHCSIYLTWLDMYIYRPKIHL